MPSPPTIVFLTDYGLADPFVGLCHAVIAGIAPAVRVIDLTHAVPPQNIRVGATLLADALPYVPPAILLAVVDPGVGTSRRAVVVEAGGRLLVGPDNGLLWPAVQRLGGAEGAWEIREPSYLRTPVSRTFHGRDVFAPAAAHLAGRIAPSRLGPAVDPATLVPLTLPLAVTASGCLEAEVLTVDRFGNLQLNATPSDLPVAAGQAVEVVVRGEAHRATAVTTFGEVERGALALLEDSFGRLAVAVNSGSAAALLQAAPATPVRVRPVSGVGIPSAHERSRHVEQ